MNTSLYKNYRIVTDVKGDKTNFEIYAPASVGARCEAVGYEYNDYDDKQYKAYGAEYRAKQLIDSNFETEILSTIRKISKY